MYWFVAYCILFYALLTAAQEPCSLLQDRYSGISGQQRAVHINGQDHDIEVWGAGGAPRAQAGLLLAIIRRVHKYMAKMIVREAYFCDLITSRHSSVILAPVTVMNTSGCGPNGRAVDQFVGFESPAIAPTDLRFMAYYSTTCSNLSWRLLQNANIIEACGFESINNNSTQNRTYATVFVRNETIHDHLALKEFENRATASKMLIRIQTFDSDKDYRSHLYHLRYSNRTFLFIDENLWSHDPNTVFLDFPQCVRTGKEPCDDGIFLKENTVRFGDGAMVKKYAPNIYDTLTKFAPTADSLNEILEYEIKYRLSSIEDAACKWLLDNDTFLKTFQFNKNIPLYRIEVILCHNDTHNGKYERVAQITSKHWNDIKDIKFTLYKKVVNCSDKNELRWAFKSLTEYKNVAGAVAWGWDVGVEGASNLAKYLEIPLMVAGPVSDTVVGQSTYATSSTLSVLAQAYQHFLSECRWNRVAIISDATHYSKDFLEAIVSNAHLNYKNVFTDKKNISTILWQLKQDDVRVFILNTNCRMANTLVLEAQNVFTDIKNYVWLVRDWCVMQNIENEHHVHFTIDFAWRGVRMGEEMKGLDKDLIGNPKLPPSNSTITPGMSYLANALMLLVRGFTEYYRNNPEIAFDPYGTGGAKKFSKAITNLNVSGVGESVLHIKNYSLYNPNIFVDKWQGNQRRTMAIWQVINDSVVDRWMAIKSDDKCTALLDGERVEDSNSCIIKIGDAFTPICLDIAIPLLPICVFILIVVFYLIFTMARNHYIAYNKVFLADLLESRHENASSLTSYLVKRESIKLIHEIGSGCYGRVYFAELRLPGHETLVVAAKKLRKRTTMEENELLREACILARLEHTNVIKLKGICLAKGSPLLLMEHAIYLDLIRYLIERRHFVVQAKQETYTEELEVVTAKDLTKWAIEAASAVEYLANQRLVHRDVRAANCLLDKNRSLKLADFGLALELDIDDSTYMTKRKAKFPVLWMAPECLDRGEFGLSSDVWALGVLILEIATMGARPYGDWHVTHVVRYVLDGGRPPFPPDASVPMRNLLIRCWAQDPGQRITATELRVQLSQNPRIISPTLLLPELPLQTPHDICRYEIMN